MRQGQPKRRLETTPSQACKKSIAAPCRVHSSIVLEGSSLGQLGKAAAPHEVEFTSARQVQTCFDLRRPPCLQHVRRREVLESQAMRAVASITCLSTLLLPELVSTWSFVHSCVNHHRHLHLHLQLHHRHHRRKFPEHSARWRSAECIPDLRDCDQKRRRSAWG